MRTCTHACRARSCPPWVLHALRARAAPPASASTATTRAAWWRPPRRTSAQPAFGGLEQEAADGQGPVEDVAQQLLATEDAGQRHGMPGHDAQPALRAVGGVGKGVDGRDLEGELNAADAGQVDGQPEQVGPARERREGPSEGEREMELVRWFLVLGQKDDGVLEGEEDTGVDIEGEMKVEGAPTPAFGAQDDLPHLAQRVGLDEVPLVVYMESVVDRVILQISHIPGDIDGSHSWQSLMAVDGGAASRWGPGGRASRPDGRGRQRPIGFVLRGRRSAPGSAR